MRTLLLLRHAKAVGSDPAGDHARALSERGRGQALAVAALVDRLGLVPDLALVSDARRTRETTDLVLRHSAPIVHEATLYNASAQTILDHLRAQAADNRRVMVVGHNPGIGDVARLLEQSGEPQAVIALHEGFPTAALAVLEFDTPTWSDLQTGTGIVSRFVVPERGGEG